MHETITHQFIREFQYRSLAVLRFDLEFPAQPRTNLGNCHRSLKQFPNTRPHRIEPVVSASADAQHDRFFRVHWRVQDILAAAAERGLECNCHSLTPRFRKGCSAFIGLTIYRIVLQTPQATQSKHAALGSAAHLAITTARCWIDALGEFGMHIANDATIGPCSTLDDYGGPGRIANLPNKRSSVPMKIR
jgi:hypothetical protein